jgi:hypothetical protein
MSENEGGESRTVGAFFLGFLLGVLVSLGAAGSLWFVMSRQARAQAEAEMRAREAAQEEAIRVHRARRLEAEARRRAEAARAKAEKALEAQPKKAEK